MMPSQWGYVENCKGALKGHSHQRQFQLLASLDAIQFLSFSYLWIGACDGFPKRLPRYPKGKVILVKLCRQILEENTLCSNVKKIVRIPFPIVVGPYSHASRSNAKNLVKIFEKKIKLVDYEVLRPQYDPVNFVRDHLKLGYAYRYVPNIEDY